MISLRGGVKMGLMKKKIKDFDVTYKIESLGFRVFYVDYEYSHFSDYEVYKDGIQLTYATSLEKIQNKRYKLKTPEEEELVKKFYSTEYNSTFMVHKRRFEIDHLGRKNHYGAEIILGGDKFTLRKGGKVRIVRKIKKNPQNFHSEGSNFV